MKEPPVTKDEMIDHAITLGMIVIEDRQGLAAASEIDGCFTRDGRTTPSATRLEACSRSSMRSMGDESARRRARDPMRRS